MTERNFREYFENYVTVLIIALTSTTFHNVNIMMQ